MKTASKDSARSSDPPVPPDGPRPMVILCARCPGAREATLHLSSLGYPVSHGLCGECKNRALTALFRQPHL